MSSSTARASSSVSRAITKAFTPMRTMAIRSRLRADVVDLRLVPPAYCRW
jgi:hypothetical protein